jgi:hypothetical protein
LNSFKLTGVDKFDAGYRLIHFTGLLDPRDDDDYERKVRLLCNMISGDPRVKLPVEPVQIEGRQFLAIAGASERLSEIVIPQEKTLTPEVVTLSLEARIRPLRFREGNGIETLLAKRALNWAIDQALGSFASGWWRYGRRFISRIADENGSNHDVLVYPAFYVNVAPGRGGWLDLIVDPSACYVERRSVYEKYGLLIPSHIKGKRYLYKNGRDWYKIDALGVGGPAGKEMMEDPDSGETISIYQRLINRWGKYGIEEIANLSSEALTIAYKTAGQKYRRAASDLLFEMPGVEGTDEGEDSPHEESILEASVRGQRTLEVIEEIRYQLTLFGKRLNPNANLRRLHNDEVELFSPPALRFAGDQIVRTRLEEAGRDRFRALRGIGPAESTPFTDDQSMIISESMPEAVRKDFRQRFSLALQDLYGKAWEHKLIKYDDRSARTPREKARAIEKEIANRRGYGLLVLPKMKNQPEQSKLHHYLKRNLWRQKLQTQCASQDQILGFYQREVKNGEERWFVRQNLQGLYRSYLRYLALGYLLVNKKWLWKLAEGSLRNQVQVGIDVYKGVAVFTFIYGDADLITFYVCDRAKRSEKLSADQVRQALVENLGPDLAQLDIEPESIVFHRDGRIYDSELLGIRRAILELKQLRSVPENLKYGVVEIRKTSATRPRLYRKLHSRFANPKMGLLARFGQREGALATTGYPMLKRGTAQPLYLEVVEGNIDLSDIAHDIYALSHLAFASPGSCMSLPFTIALADYILRESHPGKEDSLWEDEEQEQVERSTSSQMALYFEKGGVVL